MPDIDDMDDVVAVAFKAPTREAVLAATPVDADKNPHCPSPAHNPNDPQAFTQYSSVQSNDPLWNAPIMPDHVVLENMSDETVAAVTTAPDDYLGITTFCYGSTLASKYKNIHNDILACLEEVAGKGKITLIRPMVKDSTQTMRRGLGGNKANKFIPPIAFIARCTDKGARDRCTDQATFGATRTLAFHVTTFDATRLSHAVGFFRTDISDPPTVTARRLCYGAYEGMRKSQKLFSLFDRLTQGGSSTSRDQRLANFAATFKGRFLPHAENPIYVLFAKPCTTNPKLWDEMRAAMRTTYTDALEAFVPHANAAVGHNICADCKLDCHPKYNCMFTVRDKSWWGPLDLASALKDLRGGDSDDENEGDRRGAPRGRATRGFFGRGSSSRARGR